MGGKVKNKSVNGVGFGDRELGSLSHELIENLGGSTRVHFSSEFAIGYCIELVLATVFEVYRVVD